MNQPQKRALDLIITLDKSLSLNRRDEDHIFLSYFPQCIFNINEYANETQSI